jgi:hypothetical protein
VRPLACVSAVNRWLGIALWEVHWRLREIDASICMKVQRRLREHGIACLSVHDSFIVPAKDSSQVRDLMGEEFANACRRLRLRS